MAGKKPKIAVIGGGINGVGSALAMLESNPNVQLTVYSHLSSPDTTSDGAAGIWGPFLTPGTSLEDLAKWSKDTWDFLALWHDKKKAGVFLTNVCTVSRQQLERPFWSHIPLNYAEMNQEQLKKIGPEYVSGHSRSVFVAEPRLILPILMEAVRQHGGKFEKRNIKRFDDIGDEADLIINCSGLGSRDLVPDPFVYPIRGQIMRVKAPWINYSVFDESEDVCTYIIPNSDTIVLGGTHQEHDWRTTIDEKDSKEIWDNCTALIPELKKAEVVLEWAGLRPAREKGLRVGEDEIVVKSSKIPIIHNYGHGGSGITTFWGCALQVRALAQKNLRRFWP